MADTTDIRATTDNYDRTASLRIIENIGATCFSGGELMSRIISGLAVAMGLFLSPQWSRGADATAVASDSPFALVGLSAATAEPADKDSCCQATECCVPCWRVYGEILYLRPGNEKVAYGVPINGAIVPPAGVAPVQVGLEAVADIDFQPGFRVGASRAIDDCATFGLMYSQLDGNASSSVDIGATPFVLRSLVNHPGTTAAPTDFLQADAQNDIGLKLADIEYRRMLTCGDNYGLNYLLGLRYANLQQSIGSVFTNTTTVESVNTSTDFDGLGIRVGLEGERYTPCTGITLYGRGYASFVGGVFSGRYSQADNFRGTVVNTGWNEDRVVSILDMELGIGWTSSNGRLRVTTGYMVSAWMNTINTDDFIRSVQQNASSDSPNLSGVTTFDGVTGRLEIRF